jgi:hypothetical protein
MGELDGGKTNADFKDSTFLAFSLVFRPEDSG